MMGAYRGISLDYYGTLVKEDDAILADIVNQIVTQSPLRPEAGAVGHKWYMLFLDKFKQAEGAAFRRQKILELESLNEILETYRVDLDAEELSKPVFEYWGRPGVFNDAVPFLKRLKVPYVVISNIDNEFIHASVKELGIDPGDVITSEDCRSYKPNSVQFERALERLGCTTGEMLHVGDSAAMDFEGARRMRIDCALVNRKGRVFDFGADGPKYVVKNLDELCGVLGY